MSYNFKIYVFYQSKYLEAFGISVKTIDHDGEVSM